MLMEDDLVVPGVRHYSPDMRAVMLRAYGPGYWLRVKDEGFIDSMGTFLNREDAWKVAEENGQIRYKVSRPGTLFSENLY